LMTVVTYHMQNYFNQRRQAEFEPRPKPGGNNLLTANSRMY